MPKAQIKDEKTYRKLRGQGESKERAARIANAIRSVSRPPAIWSVSSTQKITLAEGNPESRRISTEPARVAQWKCVYKFPEIN